MFVLADEKSPLSARMKKAREEPEARKDSG